MLKEEVYEYLREIPKGKVVTYGQIGTALGNKGYARAIGNILHDNPDTLANPCYQVVNSKGMLARNFADGIAKQRERLIKDGVEVIDDRVDLKKYQWHEDI